MAYNPKGKGGFNRGGRGGGGAGFSGRKPWERGAGASRGPGRGFDNDREMFQATCVSCHEACEVPFRPSAGKPVYCKACFDRSGGRDEMTSRPRYGAGRPESSHQREPHAHQHHELREQLEKLNAKMDRLIAILSPKEEGEPSAKKPGFLAAKKERAAKKVAKKKVAEPTEE